MKSKRQSAILDIIENSDIATQEALLNELRETGYKVTQATVSRDIRELGIQKARTENGKFRYISLKMKQSASVTERFAMIYYESAKSVDFAQNIVVVKCCPGMANAACAMFDAANFNNIVGTLSGDDTFFIVTKSIDSAEDTAEQLKKLLKK
jgi:transcriptional regulator of arginine metabolism